MRTLVFGGEGMLGRSVVAVGRRRGWPVLGLGRSVADVTRPTELAEWVQSFRPELVVNCSAFTRVDDAETEVDLAHRVNGEGAANLAAVAKDAGLPMAHVSTDYVFDGRATAPYLENAETAPISVYGASKLEGEERVLEYEDALAVRTSWLFGPGGPNFALTMASLMEGGRRDLRVVDDQVGCPTYTPFLARAILDLAEMGARGLFHYRNGPAVSWHGFASEIARQVAPDTTVTPVPTSEFPRPAPRPAFSVLDVNRFERSLGRPVEDWKDGLTEYLQGRRGTARARRES